MFQISNLKSEIRLRGDFRFLDETANDLLRVDPLGLRRERRDDAVRQHGLGDAFNVFQRGLHQFEIVRLCALWDKPDADWLAQCLAAAPEHSRTAHR